MREVELKVTRIEGKVDRVLDDMERLSTNLVGKDGHPGMLVRLDRVEQSHARMARLFWLVLGAAATALAKAFIP